MLRNLVSRQGVALRSSRLAGGHHHQADPVNDKLEKQPENYRPGSDSYAYENPWPKLNGGRLDWMFQDGWRRPLAKDQGAKLRRNWLWFGHVAHDEHRDWANFHQLMFASFTILTVYFTFYIMYLRPDWPAGREWGLREAHFEIERRRKAGLPLISKDFIDPARVIPNLPSDEELRDFEIII